MRGGPVSANTKMRIFFKSKSFCCFLDNLSHATALRQLDQIYPGWKCLFVDSLLQHNVDSLLQLNVDSLIQHNVVGGHHYTRATTCVICPSLFIVTQMGRSAWDRFLYLLTDPFPGSSIFDFLLHPTPRISWGSRSSQISLFVYSFNSIRI